jgi:hypothetical protein
LLQLVLWLALIQYSFASLNKGHTSSGSTDAVLNPEPYIAAAIEEANQQLQDAAGHYWALAKERNDADDDAQDRSSALDQNVDEEDFLDASQTLHEALLAKAQEAAAMSPASGDRVFVHVQTFNQSLVSGISHGSINYTDGKPQRDPV